MDVGVVGVTLPSQRAVSSYSTRLATVARPSASGLLRYGRGGERLLDDPQHALALPFDDR